MNLADHLAKAVARIFSFPNPQLPFQKESFPNLRLPLLDDFQKKILSGKVIAGLEKKR